MANPPALRTQGTSSILSYRKSTWIFLISSTVCFVSIRNRTLRAFSLTKWERTAPTQRSQAPYSSNLWFSLCSTGLDLNLHHCVWLTIGLTLCSFPFPTVTILLLKPQHMFLSHFLLSRFTCTPLDQFLWFLRLVFLFPHPCNTCFLL